MRDAMGGEEGPFSAPNVKGEAVPKIKEAKKPNADNYIQGRKLSRSRVKGKKRERGGGEKVSQ